MGGCSALALALALAPSPREARQAGRANPAGAAHRDVRRFRRRRMRLTEIPDPLANPTASSSGAALGCVSLVTFFAQAKKVTRATRGFQEPNGWSTLFLRSQSKEQSKIKSTPPQSSPALRAREEAEAEANARAGAGAGAKSRSRSRSKWMTSHSAVEERLQHSLG